MKFILSVISGLLFLFPFSPAMAQQSGDPEQYDFLKKHILFEDTFDNDKNGWLTRDKKDSSTDTGIVKASISGGYYHYQVSNSHVPFAAAVAVPIDQHKDFEIELYAMATSKGSRNRAAGVLFWGRVAVEKAAYLYFSRTGKFKLFNCSDSLGKKCKSMTKASTHFERGRFNIITIRKYKDHYYLFVNRIFEKTFPYQALSGNLLGLGAGPKATMTCEYIRVSYLE